MSTYLGSDFVLNSLNDGQVKRQLSNAVRGARSFVRAVFVGSETKPAAIRRAARFLYEKTYTASYITGVQTIRFFRAAAHRVVRIAVPVGRLVGRAFDYVLLHHLRRIVGSIADEVMRIAGGFPKAGRLVRDSFAENVFSGIKAAVTLPVRAVRRHHNAITTTFNYTAPVAALAVLVVTVMSWSNVRFAVVVEYDGEAIGYVSDTAVYDEGAKMAAGSVNNADNSFEVQRTPQMSIVMTDRSALMSEADVRDKILEHSGDKISEASGLYIDGEFQAAVESRDELDGVLNAILDEHRVEGAANERVRFSQDVQIVNGLYPVSTVCPADVLNESLRRNVEDADGVDVRPFLQVNVVRTINYTEVIAYKTSKVNDEKLYIGDQRPSGTGKDGERAITAEVVLLDGKEQNRTILETVVTREPVEEVIRVGAMKFNETSTIGDGVATMKFIYPMPDCKKVSSPFGPRWGRLHAGVDFSGTGNVYGMNIIAADGGKVIQSGWDGGYGYVVVIDHGNGYKTLYAHCSALVVTVGQKVTQGQLIAKAGSTGNSTGAHLHFEIRVNGTPQNPMNFLKAAN